MPCSNCYNGCTEIVSDKCVKYTGVDVPALGIKNGDSLSYVEQSLIEFITSVVDGTGIKIDLPQSVYCTLVTKYLPTCGDITAYSLFEALIKATCDLQTQVNTVAADIATLNANYNTGCLTGVTSTSDTHDVLQATITRLCQVGVNLTALSIDVSTNYVKISELNTLIGAYLASITTSSKYYTKMIPYTILPYYGSLSNFDITGAGTGDWEKIYLCNGQNSTPDMRGRAIVGVINGVGGGPLAAAVDPTLSSFNPNYSLGTLAGQNSVALNTTQIPSHNHTISDPGHKHDISVTTSGEDNPNGVANYPVFNSTNAGGGTFGVNPVGLNGTSTNTTGITIADTGGGQAHTNTQPVLATYYIMYIP